MRDLLPYFALLISAIACAVSVITLFRSGRWRESDAAKALLARVGTTEKSLMLHDQRLSQIEDDIAALPTKADFARLEGEILTTCKIADRTERAVVRLQDYLMERKP